MVSHIAPHEHKFIVVKRPHVHRGVTSNPYIVIDTICVECDSGEKQLVRMTEDRKLDESSVYQLLLEKKISDPGNYIRWETSPMSSMHRNSSLTENEPIFTDWAPLMYIVFVLGAMILIIYLTG